MSAIQRKCHWHFNRQVEEVDCCISGVTMLFQNVTKPGFIHIWCGAHHLDIVFQCKHSKFGNNAFYQILTRLIMYLRNHQNPISAMQLKAPKVIDNCWGLIEKVSDWFNRNNIEIDMYVNNRQLYCTTSLI